MRAATAEAEIEVGELGSATVASVGALVERVTGRPAPPQLWIDGRPCSAATALGRAGLARGNIIDVSAPAPAPADPVS